MPYKKHTEPEGRRIEWERRTFFTSVAELPGPAPVSLRIEKEIKDDLPFEWIVSGFTETRERAFDRAERAAIAASFNLFQGTAQLTYLHRLALDGKAYVIVDGRPDKTALLPLIQLAMRAAIQREPDDIAALRTPRPDSRE